MNIYIVPDTQVRPDTCTDYLYSIADHIAELKPEYLVMMGDWHDMKSCSYFDKGKKSHEVFNFIEDIEAGNFATDLFFDRIEQGWKGFKKKCKKVKLKGNHEDRIVRAWEYGDSNLKEIIKRFPIDDSRWDKVVPFLEVYKIKNCFFSHFFPNDNSGRPLGTARMLLSKRSVTCIAGHQQGFDYHEQLTGKGTTIHGLIAGSCYTHDEGYKKGTNHHFRGTVLLKNVNNGMFDIDRYSLSSLTEKYKP